MLSGPCQEANEANTKDGCVINLGINHFVKTQHRLHLA